MLHIEDRGPVRWVVLDRPERKNAVPPSGWDELTRAFTEFEASDQRALVLTGAGEDFSSGADLADSAEDLVTAETRRVAVERVQRTVLALHRISRPTLAAVDGVAVGAGLGLALGCDLVVATTRARFSCLFVRRGLAMDAGTTWLLTRAVGRGRARELALTGRMVGAEESLGLGLIQEVVEPEVLEDRAAELAEDLAAGAPLAQGLIKRGLDRAGEMSFEEALAYEVEAQTVCLSTEDVAEGVQAFLEGRPAEFRGR